MEPKKYKPLPPDMMFEPGSPITEDELKDTKGCILTPLYTWVDENGNDIPIPEINTAKLMRKYCPEIFRDYKKQNKEDSE